MDAKPLRTTALLAAALSFCAAGAVQAQTASQATQNDAQAKSSPLQSGSSAKAASTVPHADRGFVEKAAQAGMAEVEEGKLAQQHAQSDQVKQFGQRMVQDHTKANDELKRIVQSKGMTVDDKLDKSGEKEIAGLQKKSGNAFDAAYMKKQVSDHEKVIKEFQKEAKSGKDADIKRFASDTLPTLQEHLKLAHSTQQAMKHESEASSGASQGNRQASTGASSTSMGQAGQQANAQSAQAKSSQDRGQKAAREATGAEAVDAAKQERTTFPKTGM